MSSNAPKQAQDDPWRPRRVHGGFRQLRRGPDKKLHFRGQAPDEVVRMVARRHWWFLIKPALPLLGSLILFFFVLWLYVSVPSFDPIWLFLEIIIAVLVLITVVYFLYKDFVLWWLNVDIITNKRVLTWRGFLTQTRQETPLDKVTQVAIEQEDPLSFALNYGTLLVYVVGGRLDIPDVPNPRRTREALQNLTDEFKEAKPPKPKPPVPVSPQLADLLTELAKPDKVPDLPNADAKYAHRFRQEKKRGPLRTFGGPLRIPAEVHYGSDEFTVMYVQRSRYVLAVELAVPVLLLVAAIVTALFVPAFLAFVVVGILVLIVAIALIIINYLDDVFILTNKRIIDIDRKYIFAFESRIDTEYKNIKDIRVTMSNMLEFMLGYGDVYVETPGSSPNIELTHVDHPFFIQDTIYAIKDIVEKTGKVKEKNERKEELHYWFGSVVTALERQMVGRGVPNLHKLDLWTAAERADEFGMKVIPAGEDTSFPNIEPGKIVRQDPAPGTVLQVDPTKPGERLEIKVYLSKK